LKLFRRTDREFTIAKPTDADIDQCAKRIANAMGHQSISKEAMEKSLRIPGIIILVAKLKERIVGMITGMAFPSTFPPPRIDFLEVSDVESAKKGLYGILIDEFIDELMKRIPTVKYVDTNVSASNPQFVAMYSLKGFTVIGFTKGEKPLNDIVVLRKILSNEKVHGYTA
jgi:hypothetical protein